MTDRRVRRTQEALRQALVSLILEKDFESISVSEITERADVGRSTFYAHYADKEDLLQGSVERLGRHLRERVTAAIDANDHDGHPALAFCLPMLEHTQDHREVFEAMAGRRAGYFFEELLRDELVALVSAQWPRGDPVAVQAIVGGFMATAWWWMRSAPHLSPVEVHRRFGALMAPALGTPSAER